MDFPKAFLLGKMDQSKPIFMFAPTGFESFPGEIYQILLPLYGLTISSRRFYESLSEFLRAIGFEHFAGGDPCLFRRLKRTPTSEEIQEYNLNAPNFGLTPRPTSAETRAPMPSRVGPAPRCEYPYPHFMDNDDYKSSPNVRFEPFHATGLAPDAMNGLFPGTYFELAAAYVDDLLGATHETAMLAEAFVERFAAKVSPP